MKIEKCMRWFGPDDPVSLSMIKEAGASGIVTALHQVPVGDTWSVEAIEERYEMIRKNDLKWSVVESLPVHNAIKRQTDNFELLIDNYIQSIENLASLNIRRVVYNFMPVLDWVRTDHDLRISGGSGTLAFNQDALTYFDLEILNRSGAENDYTPEEISAGKKYGASLSEEEKQSLASFILLGLPGSSKSFGLGELKSMLEDFQHVKPEKLRGNHHYFLSRICPHADDHKVYVSVHPDDPPFPVLGLPRVVSTLNDIRKLFNAVPNESNTLCFCTGSFGAMEPHSIPDMAKELGSRIQFLHLRNITKTGTRKFRESTHLEGDIDMAKTMQILLQEIKSRNEPIPMRPDHGFLLSSDKSNKYYPGYSYTGRLKALAELHGLEIGLNHSKE